MIEYADIKLLNRSEIDTEKWDQCISEAPNGLIYGYSFYLDHMARHWDALVLNNYEAVMPLTWNRKWGITYLYQPPFTQQLGIFSQSTVNSLLIQKFLDQLNSHFRFAEIFLNYSNTGIPGLQQKANFILPLSSPYEVLYRHYKTDLVKNLKHADRFQLSYTDNIDLKTALAAYRKEYAKRTPHVKQMDYDRFEKLCLLLQQQGSIIIRSAIAGRNKLAIALLLRKRNRMYLLQSTTSNEGRKAKANHFLLDQVIREFAGTDIILDFEGSDIPGIAHFYQNFGSLNQAYFFYRLNALPGPLKYLKGKV